MQTPSWLEISLTVDGELAEPVAEVLARYIPDGVVIESTIITNAPDDAEGRPIGPLRVSGYLPMDNQVDEKRRQLEEALWYLSRIRPLPPPQFRPIQQEDWSASWKQHYQPVLIGRSLVIVPAWLENPSKERMAVRIDPGMAFGTGSHPTTQLFLELIETILENGKASEAFRVQGGIDVIDVGCGSGILSIAALEMGARRALGVDIDAGAIRASRVNAEANHVAEHLETGLGSLAEIMAGEFSMRQASLVLANILAPVLVSLLDEGLGSLLAPSGNLVLSGILDEQSSEVEAALSEHNLMLLERRQLGDWVALHATNSFVAKPGD